MMKKTIFFLFICSIPALQGFAQSEKSKLIKTIELDYLIGIGNKGINEEKLPEEFQVQEYNFENNTKGTGIHFTLGYLLKSNLSVGLGTAMQGGGEYPSAAPLYLDVRYYLGDNESRPFFKINLGKFYKIGRIQTEKGNFLRLGAGYQIKMGNNNILLAANYNYAMVKNSTLLQLNEHSSNYDDYKTYWSDTGFSNLDFSLGFQF